MRTANALPPKADRTTCTQCGMLAPHPIVNAVTHRCANIPACRIRQLRRANLEKAREVK